MKNKINKEPFEENYYISHNIDDGTTKIIDDDGYSVMESMRYPGTNECILMAGAPALARALLNVEWVYADSIEWPHCPECRSHKEDGHAKSCELQSALKKAGVK